MEKSVSKHCYRWPKYVGKWLNSRGKKIWKVYYWKSLLVLRKVQYLQIKEQLQELPEILRITVIRITNFTHAHKMESVTWLKKKLM